MTAIGAAGLPEDVERLLTCPVCLDVSTFHTVWLTICLKMGIYNFDMRLGFMAILVSCQKLV